MFYETDEYVQNHNYHLNHKQSGMLLRWGPVSGCSWCSMEHYPVDFCTLRILHFKVWHFYWFAVSLCGSIKSKTSNPCPLFLANLVACQFPPTRDRSNLSNHDLPMKRQILRVLSKKSHKQCVHMDWKSWTNRAKLQRRHQSKHHPQSVYNLKNKVLWFLDTVYWFFRIFHTAKQSICLFQIIYS